MTDLQPLATVRSCTALESRARNLVRVLGAGWDVYCIKNSGRGAILRLQEISNFDTKRLRDLELLVCKQREIKNTKASVSVHKQCVFLDVTWQALPAQQKPNATYSSFCCWCALWALTTALLLPKDGFVAGLAATLGVFNATN